MAGAVIATAIALAVLPAPEPISQSAPTSSPAGTPADAPRVEPADAEQQPDPDRVAVIAAAVLPTVVQVDIGDADDLTALSGNGSGVIYRDDGYIITNNHVVAGGQSLEVVFADGTRAAAEIVGTDSVTDLAVIRVDRDGLDAIEIGDSSRLRVGELAVAIGSPFGLEGSVTSGIISALNRPISIQGGAQGALLLPNVIQTDAPINPGNSGGALVGGDGRLIGINSAILSTTDTPSNAGVGFAIPVNTVIDIAETLIADGVVRHPFLGVRGDALDAATREATGVERGAYVGEVIPGTPAEQAGLHVGDVVIAVGAQEIATMEQLTVVIRNHEVGETVRITYIRGGVEHTAEVTLGELPR
ncbi:MAG TPA: trypsin-like peptidase domain-containing protein [Egibacteraceae bacterium]|nr:trypsin-like peptidase domain-containing protein [Egibacteraceae bacterium]